MTGRAARTRARRSQLAAWGIGAYGVASSALAVVLAELATAAPAELHLPRTAVFAAGILAFAIPAAFVIARHPSNPVGWVLAWVAVVSGITDLAAGYAGFALYRAGLPGGAFAAWLYSWTYALVLGPASTLLFLLFPTGRLVSRAWRPVAWLACLATASFGLSYALLPGPIPLFVGVEKPVVVGSADLVNAALALSATLYLTITVASTASLWFRARRAGPVERQQLKWLAYAAGLVSATSLAVVVLGLPLLIAVEIVTYALLAIPIAVAIAIVRYRLYDIDLLINRTLVYAATSLAIAALFFGGIVSLQRVLAPFTAGSDIAVAASTLACFALAQPVRSRVQKAVDRRFYRSRYDAGLTLDAFADALREEVDLDELHASLIGAVRQTMAPTHASLWLRNDFRTAGH